MSWPTEITPCSTPGCPWRWPASLDPHRHVCPDHGPQNGYIPLSETLAARYLKANAA